MNQILDFEENYNNKKPKRGSNRNPADIKKIIIVFAIVLIIFGIGIIGVAVYNNLNKDSEETEPITKPSITLTQNFEKGTVDVVVQSNNRYAISKIIYSWNGQDEVEEEGNNRNYINLSIDIPSGTNTLSIKAIDIRNVSIEYEKEFTRNEAEIKLTQGEGGVKISVTSQKEISYITYQWNEAEEEKIEVNATEYETVIKVPEGENTLTVQAVDIEEMITKEQIKVKGIVDEKPTLKLSVDNENFIINAEDDEGIEKVVITANDDEDITIEVGEKQFEYKVPFIEGPNQIRVVVYNVNGLTKSAKGTITK